VTSSAYVYLGSGFLALAAFWLIMKLIMPSPEVLSVGGNMWKHGEAYKQSEREQNAQMQRFLDGWTRAWPAAAAFVAIGTALIVFGVATG